MRELKVLTGELLALVKKLQGIAVKCRDVEVEEIKRQIRGERLEFYALRGLELYKLMLRKGFNVVKCVAIPRIDPGEQFLIPSKKGLELKLKLCTRVK